MSRSTSYAVIAALLGLSLVTTRAIASEPRPETWIHDPVRGVSFYSLALSSSSINSLHVIDGNFAESDRLTIGLSALTFENSDAVDEYVLWVRHSGRQWLSYTFYEPVVVMVDGKELPLELLRMSQPSVAHNGQFIEKFEYRLSREAMDRMLEGEDVLVKLRAETGVAKKHLTVADLEVIKRFRDSINTRLVQVDF